MQEQIEHLIEKTRIALSREVHYRVRPPQIQGRSAAVILILGLESGEASDPSILLTRRTETVQTHKGQYAFPGGAMDPEDDADQGLVTTALRELEEEMGISRQLVRTVGSLPQIWTPSGYIITPVVGVLLEPLEKIKIQMSPHEVEHYFWAKLSELRAPGVHSVEMRRYGDLEFPVEVYQLGEHRVWGATGAMLKNFLDRVEDLF